MGACDSGLRGQEGRGRGLAFVGRPGYGRTMAGETGPDRDERARWIACGLIVALCLIVAVPVVVMAFYTPWVD
jgi:hypothetical protein